MGVRSDFRESREASRPVTSSARGIAEKLAFLGDPASYVDRPRSVTRIDTHMAWVFLAGHRALKLKRPVRTPFLDFSTIGRRRRDCIEEVRLNRRLAPSVYLGVLPLVRRSEGGLGLGGDGEPVDWLVEMRRLDAALFLDRLIAEAAVSQERLHRAARLLARFHADAPSVPLAPEAFLARMRARARTALEALRADATAGLPAAGLARLSRGLEAMLEALAPTLMARAAQGRIVEGHGDLRPEHVWLGEPPAIIDCLEFDRELRVLDPLEELAFLTLELDLAGAPGMGRVFEQARQEIAGDVAPAGLPALYRALQATLRARLTAWHVHEPGRRGAAHWRRRSRLYLEAALASLA